MTNQLAADLPPRTHNAPPISEMILEALAPFLGRKSDLLKVAETAVIVDDESAAKCIDLAGMIGALGKELDSVRVEMKAPHLVATRVIDSSFGAEIRPLAAAGQSLRTMLTAYQRKRDAEAIRPEPVRAQLGSLGTQRSIAFDITDMRKLLAWILRQPMKSTLETEVSTLMRSYLRQIGVEAVAKGVEIPGLAVWIETQAAIRR